MSEGNDIVGWLALVASVAALLVSGWATLYAKRQADAAVGNMPPDVSMLAKVQGTEMGRSLRIFVTNHNRERVFAQSFLFSAPTGVRIYRAPVDLGVPPNREISLPHVVPIEPINERPNKTAFDFVFIADDRSKLPERYEIRCETRFRVGYSKKVVKRTCFQVVER